MPTPGPLELVIILVIALLVLGPGKLPEVGASLGKSIREFRKASSDVQESVNVDTATSPLPATPPPPVNAPGAATPAVPITAPEAIAPAPAPTADAAPTDPSNPTQTESARSTNAADSPITAG
jgi:TatA/E family protein of Tat protein translocase